MISSLSCFGPSFSYLNLAYSGWKDSYAAATALTQASYCFFLSILRFSSVLIKSIGKGFFFVLRCKQNRVLVSVLSKGRNKTLSRAVCRDMSRKKRNVLGRDCCRRRREQKQVKIGARDKNAAVMRLMRDRGESCCVDARRCFTTTSGRTSACMNKEKSSCRGMHWPDWTASSGGRGLLFIREETFSWNTHREEREEELWTAE